VFGPVLHVLRFAEGGMESLIDSINATGYGLTFGVHTRIDETMRIAAARSEAGNVYVNRNLIGAVVGSQPFGGTGLSGTGPKAGGPLILHRLRTAAANLALLPGVAPEPARRFLALLAGHPVAPACTALLARSPFGAELLLPGPVGERNSYGLRPRGQVLCVAQDEASLLLQVAAALATGNRAFVRADTGRLNTHDMVTLAQAITALPESVSWGNPTTRPAVALASAACLPTLARELAMNDGAVIALHRLDTSQTGLPLEWLTHERSLSVNTTAAGGNASLMALS
jgi:RHH-type proline utilization regulon transcriptional repressor/proline dehydrogenase/delta 1-pyrroline-5-carboxylate dehydrogenase